MGKKDKSSSSKEDEQLGLIQSLKAYPPAVYMMLGDEFCERFSFYGMKAILTIYFIYEHNYSESQAASIYHAFTCLAYFSPLFGSLLADSYFGKFKVILYGSMFYVLGHVLLSFGAVPTLDYSLRTFFDFGGLVVIALGTGSIKPCVSAFAADQFSENQRHLRTQFFSFFYFAINLGSLFAIALTPILRGRVSCLGSKYCFPLAFGVPGILMVVALIFFLAGWKMYRKNPPTRENLLGIVVNCIWKGGSRSLCGGSSKKPVDHWLDRAAPDYSDDMITAVKSFLNIGLVFMPLVLFWALFDQQGSTWVLQVNRMDGRLGKLTILPDQVNILNPLIVIIMVPIFEAYIYPALKKVIKLTPLRKMAVGGLLTGFAFVLAGFVQLKVNGTMEPGPSNGEVFVQFIGNTSKLNTFSSSDGQLINDGQIPKEKMQVAAGIYNIKSSKGELLPLDLSGHGMGYVAGVYELSNGTQLLSFNYKTEKTENGMSAIYFMVPGGIYEGKMFAIDSEDSTGEILAETSEIKSGGKLEFKLNFISSDQIDLYYGKDCHGTNCPRKIRFKFEMGTAYVLHVHDGSSSSDFTQLVRGNTVNIIWVLPQYIIITLGEILLSVTGLEFAYSQAAPNMKSVLQALWLLTVFAGNAIDIAISGSHVIPEPATEFFFYAALMFAVMGIFIFVASRYKYVDEDSEESEEAGPIEQKEALPSDNNSTMVVSPL